MPVSQTLDVVMTIQPVPWSAAKNESKSRVSTVPVPQMEKIEEASQCVSRKRNHLEKIAASSLPQVTNSERHGAAVLPKIKKAKR